MAEANARRQFVNDVLAQRSSGAAAQAETREDGNEIARPGVGHDYMLELRFKDGRSTFLDYTYFPRCDYDPQRGIRLRFSTCDVWIEGSNLRDLLEEIISRKRRWVAEDANASRLVKLVDAAPGPFVSRIVIDDGEESSEQNRSHPVQR
jgi:hypothetical protein